MLSSYARSCFHKRSSVCIIKHVIIELSFRMIGRIIKSSVCVTRLSLRLRQITQTSVDCDNSCYHDQPHPTTVNWSIVTRVVTFALNEKRSHSSQFPLSWKKPRVK